MLSCRIRRSRRGLYKEAHPETYEYICACDCDHRTSLPAQTGALNVTMCYHWSTTIQLLEYQMYKRGEALSDTLGKLTCAPLAGGHTPREGGSLGTGVWRGGSKGGTSHPSPEGLIPQD